MGFFDTAKPKISKREFLEARSTLSSKGFNERELNEVQKIFRADLDDVRESERGIDTKEFSAAMDWLRAHLREHALSSHKLDILEEVMLKKL